MARRIVCFPGDDIEFARYAAEVAASIEGEVDDVQARLDAEAALRERYPAAVLSRKEPLAALAELDPVTWYAYRDGRLIPAAGVPGA